MARTWYGAKKRPRALVAAGQRITPATAPTIAARATQNEWQNLGWQMYDACPELRSLCDFVENCMSRMRIYPAENRPRGEQPIPLTGKQGGDSNPVKISPRTQAAAQQAVDLLDMDARGNSLLGRLGVNHEVAGEAFLLGVPDGRRAHVDWSLRSMSEIRIAPDGRHVQLIEPGLGAAMQRRDMRLAVDGQERRGDEVELLRLWNPHPRFYDWANSKIIASLGTCKELVILGNLKRSALKSRIGMNGLVALADELTLTAPGQTPVEVGDPATFTEDHDDVFMRSWDRMWQDGIGNDDSPVHRVPGVIRASIGDRKWQDLIHTVELPGTDPGDVIAMHADAVATLARGMDTRPERLQGVGDVNHWNGAVVEDGEIKQHLEPRVERALDALTAAYLRPYCLAVGCPPEEVEQLVLWYDAAELSQPADPWAMAKDAHAALAISDEALRRAGNFGNADAPSDRERLERRLAAGVNAQALPALVMLAEMDLSDPAVRQAVLLTQQLAARDTTGAPGGRVVEGGPARLPASTPAGPAGALPATTQTPATSSPSTSNVTITAAATRKGPADDPDGPTVAGVALLAADTGRVLMLQRALGDTSDPAAGTWEFPGGHIEDGDDTSLHGGMREWSEEVGQPFPPGGTVLHTWTSGNGVYQGHAVVIPHEHDLDLTAKRTVANPDDDAEQCAWIAVDKAKAYPDLRPEVRRGTPWGALRSAVRRHRSPRAKVAAAGPLRELKAAVWRVDEHTCRDLAQVDTQIVAELGGWIDAQILRMVEQGANRIRSGALRASAGPEEKALFDLGRGVTVDPVAIVARAGPDYPWSVPTRQALDGALDRIRARWTATIGSAGRRMSGLLERLTGRHPAELETELARRAEDAWPELARQIEATAADVLHGGRTVGDDDTIVPRSAITRALTVAGGGPETGPATGLSAGPVVADTVRGAGGVELGYEWSYFGPPRDPFPPHVALSGVRFSSWTDLRLAAGEHASWVGPFFHPGDHGGCGCSVHTIWATPMRPEEPRARADDQALAVETDRQRQTRELAEADDAAGRVGTTAQRARDRTLELRRLREQHIDDREAS